MNLTDVLKGLTDDERLYLENLISDFDDDEKKMFLINYKVARRNPFVFFILSLLGFIGFGGIQRFYAGQYLMGLLYLFTFGFLFIGTIYDLFSFFRLTFGSNLRIAEQVAFKVKETSYKLGKSKKEDANQPLLMQ